MIILNESAKLSFSQVYTFVRMMYKPYEQWDAYKRGVIDKDGKILKPDSLEWMELLVRNIRELILKHAIVKGTRGQSVLDKNIYKYIEFLKESINEYEYISERPLTENEVLRISISTEFELIMNKMLP